MPRTRASSICTCRRNTRGTGSISSASARILTSTPLPNYLLDRSNATNAKALSSAIKNKRAEKAAKFSVPLPKVKGISEEQMFKVVKTGKKTAKKSWKRMITQPTFVGQDFTRRPVKYERFIRPMGLRYKKANVSILVRHYRPDLIKILRLHTQNWL